MIERLSASSIRRVAEKPYCSMPATLWAARRRGATIARPMITSASAEESETNNEEEHVRVLPRP